MQTFDFFSFCYGMSAASYFMSCLLCGLHLCFDIFRPRQSGNVMISRLLGTILLALAFGDVFYILSAAVPGCDSFWHVGYAIDYLSLILVSLLGYVLCSNNQPSLNKVLVLSLPFSILIVIFMIKPDWDEILLGISGLIMIGDYAYYAILLRKREDSLDDLYSNPKPHSLRWTGPVVCLFVGWFAVHCIFQIPALSEWHEIALSIYMTFFVLYATVKVGKYGEPVNRDVQKEIDNVEWDKVSTGPNLSNPLQTALIKLLEDEQLYLCPDLTVDDVVKRLGTNPRYFSAVLHNNMHTTFCALINEYRVNRAKVLLKSTNDKISVVSMMCGFNSVQSFYRTFSKFTGKTPKSWRSGQ